MQNTIMQKSEFSKMRECSGFLQIGSQMVYNFFPQISKDASYKINGHSKSLDKGRKAAAIDQ